MSRRNVDLGSGSVGKLLFSLAVPTITSQIVNMLYNLAEISSGTLTAQGQHHQRQSVPLHKGGQLRLAPQHIGLLL